MWLTYKLSPCDHRSEKAALTLRYARLLALNIRDRCTTFTSRFKAQSIRKKSRGTIKVIYGNDQKN